MKKAMISQPMNGKTEDEIKVAQERAAKTLKFYGHEVVDTLFTSEWYSAEKMRKRGVAHHELALLGEAIVKMSMCDTVYFCKGWETARGCKIEHEAAKTYGLDIIYEV